MNSELFAWIVQGLCALAIGLPIFFALRRRREGRVVAFTLPVDNCARCGGHHDGVDYFRMIQPCGELTHWGKCPNTHDPILLQIIETPDPE